MSDLVEKVQKAICFKMNHSESGWVHYEHEARAAIAAVAEWLDGQVHMDDENQQVLIAALRAAAGSALEAKP